MKKLPKHLNLHPHTNVYAETGFPFKAPHVYQVKDADEKVIATVYFQEGPIVEEGINGVMNENLIVMVMDRLEHFQQSEYACLENSIALSSLNDALKALDRRTSKRIDRGVEGTHEV